jgi:hypothetical protein
LLRGRRTPSEAETPAASVVAGRLLSQLLLFSEVREPLRSAAAPVGKALFDKLGGMGSIYLAPLRLDVRSERTADLRALVPLKPKPAQTA